MAQQPSKIQTRDPSSTNVKSTSLVKAQFSNDRQQMAKESKKDEKTKQEHLEKKNNDNQVLNSIIIKRTTFISKKPIDLNLIIQPLSNSETVLYALKMVFRQRHMIYDKENNTVTINSPMLKYRHKLNMLIKSSDKNYVDASWAPFLSFCFVFVIVFVFVFVGTQ